MKRLAGIGFIALIVAASATSFAQHAHEGHDMGAMSGGEAEQAYQAANAKMHESMAISYSGDADIDFTRGMIAHHQGAIDMAKVVLKYGKNPEIRKLAEEIIAAQDKETAFMQGWLKQHAK